MDVHVPKGAVRLVELKTRYSPPTGPFVPENTMLEPLLFSIVIVGGVLEGTFPTRTAFS